MFKISLTLNIEGIIKEKPHWGVGLHLYDLNSWCAQIIADSHFWQHPKEGFDYVR